MIEKTIDLLGKLIDKIDLDKEEVVLSKDIECFLQAFYRHQEAQLRKARRELDEELDRNSESSTL
jgi:RIO-like serine/threonine protein kinase